MSTSVAAVNISKSAKSSVLVKFARKMVLDRLANLHTGVLVVQEGGERHEFGDMQCADTHLIARMVINDPACYVDILSGGSIGAAESYMTGDWDTPNLTAVIRVLARNMDILDQLEGGLAKFSAPARKVLHLLNRNSTKGAKRNIAAHYDLGNDFFELFLDETMMYSSGMFPTPTTTLKEASEHKLKTICDKLDLKPTDRVVEIGTGWGGFAIFAAKHYGCHVTTTTISEEQYHYAQTRISQEGLGNQITLLKEDYRNLEGEYDKLVSIEMIEAVGWKYYPTFFAKCSSLLKQNGLMLIQAITIEDQRYERAKKDVDFIQRYIFPGSCIPSMAAMLATTQQHTDVNLFGCEDFAHDYAKTLREWRLNFNAEKHRIKQMGYSETFLRMWEFYFCYCEGGFWERAIGVNHLVFAKPQYRPE